MTTHALLRDAARWRAAGLLFRRPDSGRSREAAGLAREADDADLVRAAREARDTEEGLYHAWLGPGGPLSPREVSYRPVEDPGRILAEIAAFHRAFAYRAGVEDPVDHVAVAADFVAYLALKEAYAAAGADRDHAATTREARERFVERHVRPMARGMARRLSRVENGVATGHFVHAVGVLARLSGADTEAARTRDVDLDAPFLPPGLDDASFDCGGCTIPTSEKRSDP